jgi:F-type H+-transporting ATPase subunit b
MFRAMLVVLLAVASVASTAANASAAKEAQGKSAPAGKHDQDHGDAKHGHGGDAKEPHPFQGLLDLTIWTIVVFLVLLFVLSKMAWKPMLEGLKKREENIRNALEEAQKSREEANMLHAQYKAEMEKASEKVREIMDEARRDAQHTADELLAKARAEIQAEGDRKRREIERALDQALQELLQRQTDLAALVASKAIRKQLNSDEHHRLIREALDEIPKVVAERKQTVRG